jgi:hypothetical protein
MTTENEIRKLRRRYEEIIADKTMTDRERVVTLETELFPGKEFCWQGPHYRDFAGNCAYLMLGTINPRTGERIGQRFDQITEVLGEYLRLLEEHTQFRDAELNSVRGYLSDSFYREKRNQAMKDVKEKGKTFFARDFYINFARQRLESEE